MTKNLVAFMLGCALLAPAPAMACGTSVVFFGGHASETAWRPRPPRAAATQRSRVELASHRTVGDGISVVVEHEHGDLAATVLSTVETELGQALRRLRDLLSARAPQ